MSDSHQLVVSVVGFTAHGNTYSDCRTGVGKSCLCCRFRYGGVDDYVSEHPSLLALHEFESQVVSADPFLYWGPQNVTYPAAGKATGKEVAVKIEVLEHTVFYHDETSQPFPHLEKLLQPREYAKKAGLPPESKCKISYYARDAIGFAEKYICLPYPSNPDRLPRGFLLVVDVSLEGSRFVQQMTAVETIAYELRKHHLVIAATKRDIAKGSSLSQLMDWAGKQKLSVIETSAKENVNIEDAFRVVAAKVLPKKVKISDQIPDYATGTGRLLLSRSQAKKDFKNYLRAFVYSSSVTLENMEKIAAYQTSLKVLGKFVTDEMLACYLLLKRSEEVDEYPGVRDNPDMKLEILEDYVIGLEDFCAHQGTLYTMMNSLVAGPNVYANESSPTHFLQPLVNESITPAANTGNLYEQEQQQPTSPGKYVTLHAKADEVPVDQTDDASIPNTGLIEEVYDRFDTETEAKVLSAIAEQVADVPVDEVTQLAGISIKERALLLKRQISGETVNVTDFLSDHGNATPYQPPFPPSAKVAPPPPKRNPKHTVSPDSSPQGRVADEKVPEVKNSLPPKVATKPSGYQKWKVSKNSPSSSPQMSRAAIEKPAPSPSDRSKKNLGASPATPETKHLSVTQPSSGNNVFGQETTQSGASPLLPRTKPDAKKNYEKKEIKVLPDPPTLTNNQEKKTIPPEKRKDYEPRLPGLRKKYNIEQNEAPSLPPVMEDSVEQPPNPSAPPSLLPVTAKKNSPVPATKYSISSVPASKSSHSATAQTPPLAVKQLPPLPPQVTSPPPTSPPSQSPSQETSPPPPIPARTTEMFQPLSEEKNKTSPSKQKKHNYFNTILKTFSRNKEETEEDATNATPTNVAPTNAKSRRATQVNMKTRPLPNEPVISFPPGHTADDYERPDQFFSRPPMPLPPINPHYPTPYLSPFQNPDIDPRWINPNWFQDMAMMAAGHISPQHQSDHISPQHQSGHISPQHQSVGRPYQHSSLTLPKRSQSFQHPHHHYVCDVDEDGYERTDQLDMIRMAHQTRKAFSVDYDYPLVRGYPLKKRIPLPPRDTGEQHRHRQLVKEDSYVNMDVSLEDDYANSIVVQSMVDSVSPKRLPPRQQSQRSMDDSNIYYNMRDRHRSNSPPAVVPPRSDDFSPISVSEGAPVVPEIPQKPALPAKPTVSQKPAVPAKKRSGSKLPDITAESKFEVVKHDDDIDEETGQKNRRPLPPRNIPRPGFPDYTIVID